MSQVLDQFIQNLNQVIKNLDSLDSKESGGELSFRFLWDKSLDTLLCDLSVEHYFFQNKKGAQFLGLKPQAITLEEANKNLKEKKRFLFSKRKFEEERSTLYGCPWLLQCHPFNEKWLIEVSYDPQRTSNGINPNELIPNFLSHFQGQGEVLKEDLTLTLKEEIPHYSQWEEVMAQAIKLLKSPLNSLSKVVLCRKKVFQTDSVTRACDLFTTMLKESSKSSANLFKILICENDTQFMAFSPESLHVLERGTLQLEAIAGTRPYYNGEKNEAKNAQLGQELLEDPKEREEHQRVVDLIQEKANGLGKITTGERTILKLKGLQHLHTPIQVKLNSASTRETLDLSSLLDLMDDLHPTPAVGGTPTEEALEFIKKHEGERGLYAGLFGVHGHILDPSLNDGDSTRSYSESTVLIRSLNLVDNRKIMAYGGAGIVADSTAQGEWQETANKIDSFMDLIESSTLTTSPEVTEGDPLEGELGHRLKFPKEDQEVKGQS